jgi:SNF2 family DNA or RNA helicase
VKRKQRVENIQKFSDSARFFIANKTCAGYGLNLQFCSYEIFYSNDWNYATRAQAEDRAHRIGQMDNVHILDICADETLDERILDCLNKKERLADSFKYQIEKMKDTKDLGRWLDGAKVIRKQKCV